MTLTRSLSNYKPNSEDMQVQIDRIDQYLQKKFRISHSFDTKNAYRAALKKFTEFLRIKHDYSLEELLELISEKLDPLDVLDEYYTFLSN